MAVWGIRKPPSVWGIRQWGIRQWWVAVWGIRQRHTRHWCEIYGEMRTARWTLRMQVHFDKWTCTSPGSSAPVEIENIDCALERVEGIVV